MTNVKKSEMRYATEASKSRVELVNTAPGVDPHRPFGGEVYSIISALDDEIDLTSAAFDRVLNAVQPVISFLEQPSVQRDGLGNSKSGSDMSNRLIEVHYKIVALKDRIEDLYGRLCT